MAYVTEYLHKGFLLKLVEGEGWKFAFGDTEYLLPNLQAAKGCIDGLIEVLVMDYGGKRL
jgi:hypothetical protein